MNKKRLLKIINEEEEEYKWGGSEDFEGTLHSGHPDFDRIRRAVKRLKIQDKQEVDK